MIATLAAFAPVELDEVVRLADLQTRQDRKYLLPPREAETVLAGVDGRALEIDGRRCFRYESVYFDTADRVSFLGAARRRPRRFKVRTRTYLDSGACLLEAKLRGRRGTTVKHRFPYDPEARDRLTVMGARCIGDLVEVAPHVDDLEPVLTVAYRRSTLVLDGRWGRVTVDEAVTWATSCDGARLDGLTLIETKTPGPPGPVDRMMWRAGHRPVNISKYCTGMALLHQELPSNKWHRVLHHDVLPNLAEG